jgi:hypothetical protein
MEVKIEAVTGESVPEDTFISMRVGDVQKQSRFTTSRQYQFPDPGDSRGQFGRIEVFQRVGHKTLTFDGLEGAFQQIQVPCKFVSEAQNALNLKVAAKMIKAATAPDKHAVDKKSKARARLDAAQVYLAEHHIEELLADAMKEVIQAKPKDPYSFLSNQILKSAGSFAANGASMLPPIPTKPQVGAERPTTPTQERKSAAPPSKDVCRPGSRGEKLPPLGKNAPMPTQPPCTQAPTGVPLEVKTTDAVLSPKSADIRALPSPAWQAMYARFPAMKQVKVSPKGADFRALAKADWQPIHAKFPTAKHVETTATACTASQRVAESLAPPFRPYFSAHVVSTPTAFSKLYARFARYQDAPRPPVCELVWKVTAPTGQTPAEEFGLLPSVGTWLQPLPVEQSVKRFQMMPSAGTWIQPLLQPEEQSEKFVPTLAAVPAQVCQEKEFSQIPSVGTWLQQLPPVQQKPSRMLPSVGTWLQHRIDTAQITEHFTVSDQCVIMPSAGTALQSVPVAMEQPVKSFGMMPSVGTWIQHVRQPVGKNTLLNAETTAAACADIPQTADVKAPTGQMGPPLGDEFGLLPSVGTWQQPLPVVQPGKPFVMMPSVGTWVQALLRPSGDNAAPQAADVKVQIKITCGDFRALATPDWQRIHAKFPAFGQVKTAATAPLAAPQPADEKAQVKVNGADFRSLSTPDWQRMHANFPALGNVQATATACAAVPQAPVLKAQIKTNGCDFRALATPDWQRMHAKFPAFENVKATAIAPIAAPPVVAEKAQVKINGADLRSLATSDWQRIHARFPAFEQVKTTAAACAPAPQASDVLAQPHASANQAVAPSVGSIFMPSVGTWLVTRLRPGERSAAETCSAAADTAVQTVKARTDEAVASSPPPWYNVTPRPSQGVEISKQMRGVISQKEAEIEKLKAKIGRLEAGEDVPGEDEGKELEDLRREACTVLQQASVSGKVESLLVKSRQPTHAGPPAGFEFMASVGTWIANKPLIGVPPAPCPPKSFLERPSVELKSLDHSELIDAFKTELKRRDEEIALLRSRIDASAH